MGKFSKDKIMTFFLFSQISGKYKKKYFKMLSVENFT